MHFLLPNSHITEHSTSIEDVDRFIDALKQKVVRTQQLVGHCSRGGQTQLTFAR